jgi:hypothetical protein
MSDLDGAKDDLNPEEFAPLIKFVPGNGAGCGVDDFHSRNWASACHTSTMLR